MQHNFFVILLVFFLLVCCGFDLFLSLLAEEWNKLWRSYFSRTDECASSSTSRGETIKINISSQCSVVRMGWSRRSQRQWTQNKMKNHRRQDFRLTFVQTLLFFSLLFFLRFVHRVQEKTFAKTKRKRERN